MKRIITCAAGLLLAATLFAGPASAAELRGRLAATARVGVVNPTDNERSGGAYNIVVPTDAGLLIGGGILYGIDDNVALEINIDRSVVSTPGNPNGWGDVEMKDLSIGMQYRLPERSRLVPYAGGGIDVLINGASDSNVSAIDTVFGAHIKGGLDYFVTRELAINAELKGVEAISADVKDNAGHKIGSFDPTSLNFTVGVRFFFN
ncbi:porin family protein [Geomesophilobacter sediminis]|uniref:Porin family protein n=1 Tax=Geomesophilobacter sediminis TaxID=2798584 RepID=A0A8J7M1F9_9BACT|nr:porin family protein [Geomesophilobacter sediminis]MBJ6726714.1 porin family protein [Geomesophilobacter sediminis]